MFKSIVFIPALSKTLVSISLATAVLFAGQAQAADQSVKMRKSMRHQGVVTAQTQRTPTDNGFIRNTTLTNAEGKTATRNASVVIDKEAGTRTRTMAGTNFNGGSVSGESVATKTENGYTRESQFTHANGKVTTRSVTAVVDKEAGTVTKTIVKDLPKRDE